MRTLLTIVQLLFFITICTAQSPKAILQGTVTEKESKDPVIFGSVALYQNGVLMTGVETDFDGKYVFEDLPVGKYDLEVSYVGFPSKRIYGVNVVDGKLNEIDMELEEGVCHGHPIMIGYEIPLCDPANLTSGQTFTSGEIKRRPITRN